MINLEQRGIVQRVEGNFIYIEVFRLSACGDHCATCSAKCAESKSEIVKFPNHVNAGVGDIVQISSNSKSVLAYIGLVYGIPLVIMMLSICVSNYLFSVAKVDRKDLYSFIIGIIFLALSYGLIRKIDSKFESKVNTLMMVEKVKEPYKYE